MDSNCTISAHNLHAIISETAFRNLPPPPGDDIVLRLHFCHPFRAAQSVTWHILYMYNIVIKFVLCLIVSCQQRIFKGEIVFIAQNKSISEQTVFQISVKYTSGCLLLQVWLCSICLASHKALRNRHTGAFFVCLLFLMRHVAAKTNFNINAASFPQICPVQWVDQSCCQRDMSLVKKKKKSDWESHKIKGY